MSGNKRVNAKVFETLNDLPVFSQGVRGERSEERLVDAIFKALGEKNEETLHHSSRMSHYCTKIGKKLEFTNDELMSLGLVASLHDIGKLFIDDAILEKDSALTECEWAIMKTHCYEGYALLKAIPELSHISEYVLSHHERWDGSGYPRKLCADEIPLISRIISVVDAYDAMTNDRCYRRAMHRKEAMFELVDHAGTQFDPEIVKIMLSVLEDERQS